MKNIISKCEGSSEKEHFEEGFKQAKVPSIEELVDIAQELDIKLKFAFIDGMEVGGAASIMQRMLISH